MVELMISVFSYEIFRERSLFGTQNADFDDDEILG